jgi:Uncharacterized conserved protein
VRAMWGGAVSFGPVGVPITVYAATTGHDIRIHRMYAADNADTASVHIPANATGIAGHQL